MHFYLDASALAKRYAPEVGTSVINHLFSRVTPDKFHLFNVTMAEVVSLLVRKKNGGRLSAPAYAQALIDLGAEISSSPAQKLAADNGLITSAVPLIEVHSINSTDAIILRSALDLADSLRDVGASLVLVTSDKRLVRAAAAEGLSTFDPETQSQTDLDALLGP